MILILSLAEESNFISNPSIEGRHVSTGISTASISGALLYLYLRRFLMKFLLKAAIISASDSEISFFGSFSYSSHYYRQEHKKDRYGGD